MSEFVIPLNPSGGATCAETFMPDMASPALSCPGVRPTRGSVPAGGAAMAAAGLAGAGACAVCVVLPHAEMARSASAIALIRDVM